MLITTRKLFLLPCWTHGWLPHTHTRGGRGNMTSLKHAFQGNQTRVPICTPAVSPISLCCSLNQVADKCYWVHCVGCHYMLSSWLQLMVSLVGFFQISVGFNEWVPITAEFLRWASVGQRPRWLLLAGKWCPSLPCLQSYCVPPGLHYLSVGFFLREGALRMDSLWFPPFSFKALLSPMHSALRNQGTNSEVAITSASLSGMCLRQAFVWLWSVSRTQVCTNQGELFLFSRAKRRGKSPQHVALAIWSC